MTTKDHSDMTNEQVLKRTETLRSQNSAHIDRLQRMTGQPIEPGMAMFEFILDYMVDHDGFSREGLNMARLCWEEELQDQLNRGEEQLNLHLANQRAAAAAQQRGLVLPPGLKQP